MFNTSYVSIDSGYPNNRHKDFLKMTECHDQQTLIQSAVHRISVALSPMTGKTGNRLKDQQDSADLVCRPEENPNYILKACAKGQIEVVSYFIKNEPWKLKLKNDKGWSCLHHAANSNKVQVVDMLISNGADINEQEFEGNTALHLAVAKGCQATVRHLLMKKADASILNKKCMSIVHVAVYENKPKIIEEMSNFLEQVNFCMVGFKGGVPLHIAARYDYHECATAILKSGAKMHDCSKTSHGLTPLHLAAKYGSTKTMEVILSYAESMGLTRQHMLTYGDKEGNSPLHISVSSGNLVAVKICLDHGAEIDFCQGIIKSTPLHFACSQGILPIVKLMCETHLKRYGQEEALKVLAVKDASNMTPLHRAALFDHAPVVEYLIQQGSNLNDLDSDKRTPLLLAAYKKSLKSLTVLLDAGADISSKDVHRRNLMHYLVTKQIIGSYRVVDGLKKFWECSENAKLVNEKDFEGCSPLHYSSKDGNLTLTEALIGLGATINLKDNGEQSPLHHAAKYGRINTAKHLLESQIGLHIINENDQEGMTALHVASANGHTKVVQMLCEKGALIHMSFSGLSPLHLAAKNGFVDTMNILLSFHPTMLNHQCYKKFTALHFASKYNQPAAVELLLNFGCLIEEDSDERKPIDLTIENGCFEAACVFVRHDRWEELLNVSSKIYHTPLRGFIQSMPEVYKIILDRCHTKAANIDPQSRDYWEKFNFAFIQPKTEMLRQEEENFLQPLAALNRMVEYGRVELLNHPVCVNYLNMKWQAYGLAVFLFNFSLYATFVALLTSVLIHNQQEFMDRNLHKKVALHDFTMVTTNVSNITQHEEARVVCLISIHFMLAFMAINIVKEIFDLCQQKLNYFFQMANCTEWLQYVTTTVYIVPILMSNPESCEDMQNQCGSIAIFLAWFNTLLHLERVESVGIFIIMFQRILKTILKVVLIFSVLFVAFALAFFILLQEDVQGGFRTPFLSFIHSGMLMMGDWNFVDLYQKPYLRYPGAGYLKYPELNFFFLMLFVILIPILFINLLIGLSVGDIEMVRNDAQLKKLAMQVEYHTRLERKLPLKFLSKVDKDELLIYPNRIVEQTGYVSNMLNKLVAYAVGSAGDNLVASESNFSVNADKTFKEAEKLDYTNRKFADLQQQLTQIADTLKLVTRKMEIVQETDYYEN